MALISLVRELRRGAGDPRPLAVAGARELVPLLARELRAGGDAGRGGRGPFRGARRSWSGSARPTRTRCARASRSGVPIIAVTEAETVPYVLATDLVRVPPGAGFPVDEIAVAIARRLGEDSTALAARLPVLRGPVCDELILAFSKRNAFIAAAVFIPGVDMPLLTLNQVRLVLRIGLAYGQEVDRTRAVELLGVVGAGFGFRAVARELLDVVPFAGWAVKGGGGLHRHESGRRGGGALLRGAHRRRLSHPRRQEVEVRPVLDLGSPDRHGGDARMALTGHQEAHELLLIEEADAWFEYLETTRGQSAVRYVEVEPWAWARLAQRLRAIRTRRAKLRPAAEAA